MANTKKAAAGRTAAKSHSVSGKGSNYFDIVRSLSTDPELQKAVDAAEKRDDGKNKKH